MYKKKIYIYIYYKTRRSQKTKKKNKKTKTTRNKKERKTNKQKARTNNRMNQNIIKLIVIVMFPWGLCCKCPHTHHEPQPTSASLRRPPLPSGLVSGPAVDPVGTPLPLLWPTSCVCCPQSPQLPGLDRFHLWEHSLSTQIFHARRVCLADRGDSICSLYS